ncbi:MAG: hypothetical protein KA515_01950 [Candidatus Pacebacteria bacterium]|nr:hypothetical protein [Candidatus Paceibacterota bacterium]
MTTLEKQNQKGFMALISTIIISMILLLITINLNLTLFYRRANVLDFELKTESFQLAYSCLNIAILKIIRDKNYNPNNENLKIAEKSCSIKSRSGETIETTANNKNYITNLRATINPNTMRIKNLEEF